MTRQCPHCKSLDISMDKYCFFKCNDCNRSFDIPLEISEDQLYASIETPCGADLE